MSRGNLIQGQASGKLGSTVLMVRNGQQLARVYTTAGARSGSQASESARIQRVKFGSASNQWALYKYVSTRMYRKGRTASQSDYNYFVKRNNQLLPYFTKEENATGVHVLQPGIFAEGNLGRIDMLMQYNPDAVSPSSKWNVSDVNVAGIPATTWSATVATLKSVLANTYPNATKVTYLISVASSVSLEEGGELFLSQNVNHNAVILDLFKEATTGENSMTIAAYFASKVTDSTLAALLSAQAGNFCSSSVLMMFRSDVQADITYMGNIGAMVFATNDNASDCYTTILDAAAVNPTRGAYSIWASYRTTDALRNAAESYGYQSGVMRDEVASYGNDLTAQVQAYAARLSMVDAAAATAYLKEVEAAGGAKARVVRQAAPTEEK